MSNELLEEIKAIEETKKEFVENFLHEFRKSYINPEIVQPSLDDPEIAEALEAYAIENFKFLALIAKKATELKLAS